MDSAMDSHANKINDLQASVQGVHSNQGKHPLYQLYIMLPSFYFINK